MPDKDDDLQTIEMDCASGEGRLNIEWPSTTLRFDNIGEYLIVLLSREDGKDSTIMKADSNESVDAMYTMLRSAVVAAMSEFVQVGCDADAAVLVCIAALFDGFDSCSKASVLDGRGGRFYSQELVRLAEELGVDLPDEG